MTSTEPKGQPGVSLCQSVTDLTAPARMGLYNGSHLVVGSSPKKGAVASHYQLQK